MSAMKSVLVTGGAGYIGAHCCKALFEAGFNPVCYDNFSTGHRDFVKWGPLVEGNVRDHDGVASALREHDAIAVIHFAAFSLVGESMSDPQKYYQNNVVGTLMLLQAMREAGCGNLVFSSTGAVYGNADDKPIREAQAGVPINPYGHSKWMIEQILRDYRAAYGLKSFSLRYFNACGADPSGLVGEMRDPETHLIPRSSEATIRRRTAPPSATIFMSRTSPPRISWRSSDCSAVMSADPLTSEPATDIRSDRFCRQSMPVSAGRCPCCKKIAGEGIPLCWSRIRPRRSKR